MTTASITTGTETELDLEPLREGIRYYCELLEAAPGSPEEVAALGNTRRDEAGASETASPAPSQLLPLATSRQPTLFNETAPVNWS